MIYYREGYLYQTSRPYLIETGIIPSEPIVMEFFTLYRDGTLNIKQGYAWDGASWCPEWLVPPECSCPHDAFCQMTQLGLLDYAVYAPQFHELLRLMVADRWGGFLASIVHKAVTTFRGGHPDHSTDNPELSDPKE